MLYMLSKGNVIEWLVEGMTTLQAAKDARASRQFRPEVLARTSLKLQTIQAKVLSSHCIVIT